MFITERVYTLLGWLVSSVYTMSVQDPYGLTVIIWLFLILSNQQFNSSIWVLTLRTSCWVSSNRFSRLLIVSYYCVMIYVNFLISLYIIPTASSTFCYPVVSAVASSTFLPSACIPFVVREVRFAVFTAVMLILSSCSWIYWALWLSVQVRWLGG